MSNVKYHINEAGNPGLCSAEDGNCPFGGEGVHFPTRAATLRGIEVKFAEEYGNLPEAARGSISDQGVAERRIARLKANQAAEAQVGVAPEKISHNSVTVKAFLEENGGLKNFTERLGKKLKFKPHERPSSYPTVTTPQGNMKMLRYRGPAVEGMGAKVDIGSRNSTDVIFKLNDKVFVVQGITSPGNNTWAAVKWKDPVELTPEQVEKLRLK